MSSRRIVVTGATGFVGKQLVTALLGQGYAVTALTRAANDARVPKGAEQVVWTPERAGAWGDAIDGAHAVVHLAGEPVLARWTPETKARILSSRVAPTREIVAALGRAKVKPSVLVSASAVGFYGAREPDEELTETSTPGDGFLADVVRAWEAEAARASEHGVREVRARIGIVLGNSGGALAQMMLPFKMFVGGPVGRGDQVLSWIHEGDAVRLLVACMEDPRAHGPVNITAPYPVDMNELAKALGRALHRPVLFRVPSFAMRTVMGESAMPVLTGQRAVPTAARALGFQFNYPDVDGALKTLVGKAG